jgi:N-acetylmuramoyl-L-alanine amidase
MKGKGIALNPGHLGTVGAIGINPEITEEYFAKMQVSFLKSILDAASLKNEIIVQSGNDLTALGRQAAGYDMFLSFHFNAAVKKEIYSCFLVGTKTRQTSIDFGMKLMQNLQIKTDCKLYNNDGIMRVTKVSVLNSANRTNCPIVGLIESEFIDDEISKDDFTIKIQKKTIVIAETIINHFRFRGF